MSFIHASSSLTVAVGAAIVVLDLWRYEQRAASRRREELARQFGTVRLRSGSLLDALEQAGLMAVERDAFGEVFTITWRADLAVVIPTAMRLVCADRDGGQ